MRPEPHDPDELTTADIIERSQWDFFWIPEDATVVDRPALLYVRCPRNVPLLNCVTRTRASAHALPAIVDEVIGAHARVRSRWLVRDIPEHRPLEDALARAGYRLEHTHSAYAVGVDEFTAPAPEGAIVKRVVDLAALRDWYRVADAVFEQPSSPSAQDLAVYLEACTNPRARVHRCVAYVGNEPVSCGGMTSFPSLRFGYLWAGATLEPARGRGHYRAVLGARMEWARHLGLTRVGMYARVGSSAPIVEKQGFQRHGAMCYWDRPGDGQGRGAR